MAFSIKSLSPKNIIGHVVDVGHSVVDTITEAGHQIIDEASHVFETASNAVDNVFDKIGNSIERTGSKLSATAKAIIKNPLPIIETGVLTAVGVPYPIASAAVTAANGGKIEDIAKAYVISEVSTQVGQYAGQQFSGSEFAGGAEAAGGGADWSKASDLSASTVDMATKVITSASGAAAATALRGGNFDDLMASVLQGTSSTYINDLLIKPVDQGGFGFDPKSSTVKLITNAAGAAVKAYASNKDIADAIINSSIATGLQTGTSSLVDNYKGLKSTLDRLQVIDNTSTSLQAQRDQLFNSYTAAKTIAEITGDYAETNKFATSINAIDDQTTALEKEVDTLSDNYKNYKSGTENALAQDEGYRSYAEKQYAESLGLTSAAELKIYERDHPTVNVSEETGDTKLIDFLQNPNISVNNEEIKPVLSEPSNWQDEYYKSIGIDPASLSDRPAMTEEEMSRFYDQAGITDYWADYYKSIGIDPTSMSNSPAMTDKEMSQFYKDAGISESNPYVDTSSYKFNLFGASGASGNDMEKKKPTKPLSPLETYLLPTAGIAALASELNHDPNTVDQNTPYWQELNWNEVNPTAPIDGVAKGEALLSPKYTQKAAQGGIMHGGIASLGLYSDGGQLLKGPGDGMSDHIPAVIGKDQPARLADGEFVIPADVVSHLGNGSTEAGANVLYKMMDKIRQARTGNKKQGKQINPNKFIPG